MKYIIFIDGVCTLCNNFVKFVNKRDKNELFKFSPLQGNTYLSVSKEIQDLDNLKYIEVYSIVDEKMYKKIDGIRIIFSLLSSTRFLSLILQVIPRFISNFFYNVIAKLRYRVFGKKEYCEFKSSIDEKFFLS